MPQEYNTIQISAHKHNVYQYLPLKTPFCYMWLTWPCNNYQTHQSRSIYLPYAIYTLPVETIITSPHNWIFASKWSSMASKESRLQPSQPGLGVLSQQSLCYKSAPSFHNNHIGTITLWCRQPVVYLFWLPKCKWVHHPNSNNLPPYPTPLTMRHSSE